MPYPPGTSRRDLRRAGIIKPDPVGCPYCGNDIRHARESEHEDGCKEKDITREELAEIAHERAHKSYDDVKEERYE